MGLPATPVTVRQVHAGTAKAQPEVKDGYMYFSDILEEEKEKAAAAGEERGFTAGAEQTARNMLAEGFPAEQIARLTGLSPERVRQLETER